jgi:hypothetical protein
MGRTGTYANALIAGATYVAPNAEPVMSSPDFGSLVFAGGVTIDCLSMLSLNINNNLRAQKCLGSLYASGFGLGDAEVSGDMEIYLDTNQYATLQAQVANSALGLDFTLGQTTLKRTRFNIPKIKLYDMEVPTPGNNEDVVIKTKWRGLYDAGILATMEVSRNVV